MLEKMLKNLLDNYPAIYAKPASPPPCVSWGHDPRTSRAGGKVHYIELKPSCISSVRYVVRYDT